MLPITPLGVLGRNDGQFSLEIGALGAHQAVIGRIPEGNGFLVVQYKGILICPPGWRQGKDAVIDLPAVHSGQVDQRSVGRGDRLGASGRIGDLMADQSRDGICVDISALVDADDARVF